MPASAKGAPREWPVPVSKGERANNRYPWDDLSLGDFFKVPRREVNYRCQIVAKLQQLIRIRAENGDRRRFLVIATDAGAQVWRIK